MSDWMVSKISHTLNFQIALFAYPLSPWRAFCSKVLTTSAVEHYRNGLSGDGVESSLLEAHLM